MSERIRTRPIRGTPMNRVAMSTRHPFWVPCVACRMTGRCCRPRRGTVVESDRVVAADGDAGLMAGSGLTPPLTMTTARDRIRDQCFRPAEAGLVGLELEWHVYDRADLASGRAATDDLVELADGLGPLPERLGHHVRARRAAGAERTARRRRRRRLRRAGRRSRRGGGGAGPTRARAWWRPASTRCGRPTASSTSPATTPWRRSSTSTGRPGGA